MENSISISNSKTIFKKVYTNLTSKLWPQDQQIEDVAEIFDNIQLKYHVIET